MKKITIQNFTYQVPSDWNDFNQSQLLFLIELVKDTSSATEIQLKMLLFCLPATIRRFIRADLYELHTTKSRHALFSDELTALLSVFDFLFTKQEDKMVLTPRITKNPFKRVRVAAGKRLYGPDDVFADLTYNQFVHLQTHHAALSSEDGDALDNLISVLYRTKKGNHDLRRVSRMDERIKMAILWNYLGVLDYLQQMFPRVFAPGTTGTGNVFDNQQRIIDVLAGGDVTKKEEVRNSYLYDALYSMEMSALRIEELEKARKK